MPITDNPKILKKYIPEKFVLGSSVEVDNSGYLLQRDYYISIFPCIMEYMEEIPFCGKEKVLKFNWCAYIINMGKEVLIISKDSDFKSLEIAVMDSNFNLWSFLPPWYTNCIYEKGIKASKNIWKAYMEKDIVLYTKLQNEYGYCLGEAKNEKTFLFPAAKQNNKDNRKT